MMLKAIDKSTWWSSSQGTRDWNLIDISLSEPNVKPAHIESKNQAVGGQLH